MNSQEIAQALLKEVPLSPVDISRLILEAIEQAGDMAANKNRLELLYLLRNIIRKGAESMRTSAHTVTFREAATASLCSRGHLRPVSRRDLRYFTRRMLAREEFAGMPLNKISTFQCRRLLESSFGGSVSLFVKGRSILHGIFSYGIQREWCDSNPVTRISTPKKQERTIFPLTLREVERLKAVVRRPRFHDMKLSLSLLLYCGIRPTEVARLKRENIYWDDKQVVIPPNTSKTGGGRVVPMRCMRGLSPKELIIPNNWHRRWRDVRRAAGFRHWVPDHCRHTFASYYAAHFRDLHALQVEMGHRDSSLLRSRYVAPAKASTAAQFWRNARFD